MYTYDNSQRLVAHDIHYVDRNQYETLNGRAEHKREMEGLARKLLETEAQLEKEQNSKYPNAKAIAHMKEIIARLEKYRDPNVKLR